MKQVNIIMPVHNRWEHTKQSLDSLLANTDYHLCDIYVIDDCSDEENRKLLEEYWGDQKYANGHDWKLYHNKTNIGPGPSRNFMAKAIEKIGNKKKYIYHSDNDVYFRPGWLQVLLDGYEQAISGVCPPLRLLGGGCHPYLQNNAVTGAVLSKDEIGERAYTIGLKDAVSGYSQLMTWETWNKYGPFNESMRNAEQKIMGSEDWAFCQKIIKDGFLVGSIQPEVVVATGKYNTYGNLSTGHEIAFPDEPGIKKI